MGRRVDRQSQSTPDERPVAILQSHQQLDQRPPAVVQAAPRASLPLDEIAQPFVGAIDRFAFAAQPAERELDDLSLQHVCKVEKLPPRVEFGDVAVIPLVAPLVPPPLRKHPLLTEADLLDRDRRRRVAADVSGGREGDRLKRAGLIEGLEDRGERTDEQAAISRAAGQLADGTELALKEGTAGVERSVADRLARKGWSMKRLDPHRPSAAPTSADERTPGISPGATVCA